jgi:hypothetical protein
LEIYPNSLHSGTTHINIHPVTRKKHNSNIKTVQKNNSTKYIKRNRLNNTRDHEKATQRILATNPLSLHNTCEILLKSSFVIPLRFSYHFLIQAGIIVPNNQGDLQIYLFLFLREYTLDAKMMQSNETDFI